MDDAPLLFPIQPVDLEQGIQGNDVAASINGQENGLENQQQLDNQDNNEQNEYEAQMVQLPILELNQ